jgi:FKBP-type peptidyl-prolyl cis-trans isomerase FklB
MRNVSLAAALAVLLPAVPAFAADAGPDLTTTKARISYAIGFQVGHSLKNDGMDVDPAVVAAAIADVMAGAKPRVSSEDMQAAMDDLEKERTAALAKAAEDNKKKGAEYLAKHAKEKGVVTTKSGLEYKVVVAGKGKQPSPEDKVTVNYSGTLLSGEEFDSSYARGEPATFPIHGVIKGWQEVLPMMKEGAKWEVAIPADLAYGDRGTGHGIGPGETLLFTIELIKVD